MNQKKYDEAQLIQSQLFSEKDKLVKLNKIINGHTGMPGTKQAAFQSKSPGRIQPGFLLKIIQYL